MNGIMYSENQDNMSIRDDEISLKELILKIKELFSFVFSKWKIWVICGFSGAFIGLLASIFGKTSYVAEMTFSIMEGGRTGSALSTLSGVSKEDNAEEKVFSSDNMIELLKSKYLIEQTLLSKMPGQKRTLIDYYFSTLYKKNNSDKTSKKDRVEFPLGLVRYEYSRLQDSVLFEAVDKMRKNITITRVGRNISILKLEFKSNDELFSKCFADRLVETAKIFYVETKTGASQANLASMQRIADSLKTEYEKTLSGKVFFADQNLNTLQNNSEPAQQITDSLKSEYEQALSGRIFFADRNLNTVQANSVLVQQMADSLKINLSGEVLFADQILNTVKRTVSPDQQADMTDILLKMVMYSELTKIIEVLKLENMRETQLIQMIDSPVLPLKKEKLRKRTGGLAGGFLGGFFSVLYITGKFYLRRIMAENEALYSGWTISTSLNI